MIRADWLIGSDGELVDDRIDRFVITSEAIAVRDPCVVSTSSTKPKAGLCALALAVSGATSLLTHMVDTSWYPDPRTVTILNADPFVLVRIFRT